MRKQGSWPVSTRRSMIQQLGALGLTTAARPGPAATTSGLDRYGSLKSVRFERLGFFRVAKADRWWFVTPPTAPDSFPSG